MLLCTCTCSQVDASSFSANDAVDATFDSRWAHTNQQKRRLRAANITWRLGEGNLGARGCAWMNGLSTEWVKEKSNGLMFLIWADQTAANIYMYCEHTAKRQDRGRSTIMSGVVGKVCMCHMTVMWLETQWKIWQSRLTNLKKGSESESKSRLKVKRLKTTLYRHC